MPAFVLVEVNIQDPLVYEEYKKLTPSSVEAYGGKFVIRGNPVQVMEGSWNYDRLVLLEFPSKEIALEWYNSKEYQKAKKIREKASSANFFIVG
ncbi:DUF1330 domain-containing protein [Algoriphagus boritolerans]|uniref:Uncharacterized conserved protein, DUF1330 family n=1 Tax=Algoriphagus boritolerans DSM 17298 = JCM 18970 TaxID=1120964 RepID=A0A1H5TV68_9BACT|nr:DUF1330 domain-containing protein [Algoriphagus boritolerans]SEF66669.1 Uncharacterized conserved protein, DUF1330 family [Algoriphagus boritolerans DSM 17298 = JCM 18970]